MVPAGNRQWSTAMNAARVWTKRHMIRSKVEHRWSPKYQTWVYVVVPLVD